MCLDGFMNIAMEQAEEWSDGLLRQKYGDCFIRGNNGVLHSPQEVYLWSIALTWLSVPRRLMQCSMYQQLGERPHKGRSKLLELP